MFRLYRFRDYNYFLVAVLLMINILGVLLVNSADSSLTRRQLSGVVMGFVLMIIVSLIDYSWILHFDWLIYIVNSGLLLLVLVLGTTVLGAQRWISIGGFQFQPTEICKVLTILFFASFFMRHAKEITTWKMLFRTALFMAIPLFLIVTQPDLKNTITLTAVIFCMYFAAGLDYKKIGILLLIIIPLAAVLLFLITQTDLPIVREYQKERIMNFIDPSNDDYDENAMQQDNSIMAIGSGQLNGKGLNNNEVSTASNGNFVAEIQNDFIFAVAGEELGFIGCVFLILLEFLIVFFCFLTGKQAKDLAGMLICYGIGSMIFIQSFINICVATGLFPNTGTPLPFVSYGLTSLISLFIGMGVVLNIGLQKKKYYNDGGEYVYEGEIFKAEEA